MNPTSTSSAESDQDPSAPLILLADDDVEWTELLGEYLTRDGFRTISAQDGASALKRLRDRSEEMPDLLVLDVMMPRMNGLEVLRELRRDSQLPVLMLTARGEDTERIIGLELGADDYLAKPCNPRELVARLRAILRRSQPESQAMGNGSQRLADLELLPGSRQLRCGGEPLSLTSTEFSLLSLLMGRAGQLVDRETLYSEVLGRPPEAFDRSIDMHLSNLRRKLGPHPEGGDRFETIRGHGYLMRVFD